MKIITESNSIASKAFNAETLTIWGGSQFAYEIPEICYKRALSCWLRDNDLGEFDRKDLLTAYLRPYFGTDLDDPIEDTLTKFYAVLPTDNQYLKRAIKNLCQLYLDPPTRDFGKQSEIYNDILTECKFDLHMLYIHRLVILLNEVAARPVIRAGKLEIKYLTPDCYRIEYDSDLKPIKMVIPFDVWKNNVREVYYEIWTADTYNVVDSSFHDAKYQIKGKIQQENGAYKYDLIDMFQETPNRYKRIPYEILRLYDNTEIYGGDLWELCKAQIECNVLDFSVRENYTWLGFGVWVAKNFGWKENKLKLTPRRLIRVEEKAFTEASPPSLEVVSPIPQYDELELLKTKKIEKALKNCGLPSTVLSDNPQYPSGVAMKYDRQELEELRREHLAALVPFDKDLIKLLRLVYETDLNKKLPDYDDVKIDYQEMRIFSEPIDEFTYLTSLFDKGLMSPFSYVQKLTGIDTITDDKGAIEFIKNNLELKKQIGGNNDTGTRANASGQFESANIGTQVQGNNTNNEQGNQQTQNGNQQLPNNQSGTGTIAG